jgi:8-oxo-dGTP diphosphatase
VRTQKRVALWRLDAVPRCSYNARPAAPRVRGVYLETTMPIAHSPTPQAPTVHPHGAPTLHVVAALIWRGPRVLVQQRHAHAPLGGLWELPGGKVEPGESPVAALVREAREEMDVQLEVDGCVWSVQEPQGQGVLCLRVYAARLAPGVQPQCLAAQQQRWVLATELTALPFCPADIGLVEALAAGRMPRVHGPLR